MRLTRIVLTSLFIILFLASFKFQKELNIKSDDYVLSTLVSLGEKAPDHYIESVNPELVQKGYEIVTKGQTTNPKGKLSSIQSKHFLCTHCHNISQEDPDLAKPNPTDRLTYAIQNNMPFLPATTFHGMVNRESWYNDDYYKKYGELVRPSRDTLKNAIHLCAVECSQGRDVENWEMTALLHYFNSIGYKINDIVKSNEELTKLNSMNKTEAINWIKSKYAKKSPATFLDPKNTDQRGLGKNGRIEIGKYIYEHSCQHCHIQNGVTNFKLNEERLTFRFLSKNALKSNHFSVYNISRKGTYALPGYKPYMPNYTLERLSHQQLEDLVAYINQQAKKQNH